MKAVCSVCKREDDDIRIRTDSGCYGPVDIQTCQACHDADVAKIREESKRFRMRLRTKRWESLTTRGAFSDVR